MGCYLDGGAIVVHGNGQDQVGNTMNDGAIVVHGRIGDAAGYAMRGGTILVRGDCGWRAGIHMKAYDARQPVVVVGKDAGSFLGEYMAGGVIVIGGTPGDYVGTGMHGGVIYLRHPLSTERIMDGLIQEPVGEEDVPTLTALLDAYDEAFAGESPPLGGDLSSWHRLRPASTRPYGGLYAH